MPSALERRDALHQELAALRAANEMLKAEVAYLLSQMRPPSGVPRKWKLAPKEELTLLALYNGRAAGMTKEQIHVRLYDGEPESEIKLVDIYVCKLRQKLADLLPRPLIETLWGRGYRLTPAAREALAAILENPSARRGETDARHAPAA